MNKNITEAVEEFEKLYPFHKAGFNCITEPTERPDIQLKDWLTKTLQDIDKKAYYRGLQTGKTCAYHNGSIGTQLCIDDHIKDSLKEDKEV